VRVDVLDERLLTEIEKELLTSESVRNLISESIDRLPGGSLDEVETVRKDAVTRVSEIGRRISRLAGLIADGEIEEADGREKLSLLKAERAHARQELALLTQPVPLPNIKDVDADAFRESILQAWRESDAMRKREALRKMISSIDLEPGGAVVHYAWKGEGSGFCHQEPFGPP
jgi:hypothetical protein